MVAVVQVDLPTMQLNPSTLPMQSQLVAVALVHLAAMLLVEKTQLLLDLAQLSVAVEVVPTITVTVSLAVLEVAHLVQHRELIRVALLPQVKVSQEVILLQVLTSQAVAVELEVPA